MIPLGDEDRPFHLLSEHDPGHVVHYAACHVNEGINELFNIEVSAIAESREADFEKFMGRHMTVSMEMQAESDDGGVEPTFFDGIVTESMWEGPALEGQRYRFRLESWLAIASRRKNMRIFHEMTVIQILKKIFEDYAMIGSELYSDSTRKSYPIWEYTVQYEESDLNFVRRLMERAGISFYFKHTKGKHTLVLFDEVEALPEISGGQIELKEHTTVHSAEGRNLTTWMPRRGLVTGATRVVDYDFKHPRKRLDKDVTGSRSYALGNLESYEFPGGFTDEEPAKQEAKLRLNAAEGQDERAMASGLAYDLRAGMRFTLDSPHSDVLNEKTFLCVRASHSLPTQSYHTGSEASNFEYTGNYEMAPTGAPHAPPKVTPKPRMQGPQTGVVSGDTTTDCDEYGRILVTFPWAADEKSMRCRVSQTWAGPGWGAFVLPRQGMEVIVDFINGDPDFPIVTGCVYNGANMPPYGLPGDASRSTFRTQSVDAAGTNELRFEDKAGEEEVFLMAQKDFNLYVENNSTEHVLHDKAVRVDNDLMETAANNIIYAADNAMEISVGTGRVDEVLTGDEDGAYTSEFQMIEGTNGASNAAGDLSMYVSNNMGLYVQTDYSEEICGDKTSTVTGNQLIDILGNYTVDSTSSIKLQALTEIKLTCGGSTLKMTPSGVEITTGTFKVTAGQATVEGGQTSIKGGVVNVEGGLISLKGAIKLN